MPNWTESMQQSYEYYIVDPGTWADVKRLDNVKKSTINRDSTVATLGSASIDVNDSVGECYIRIYLVTIQNGIRERFPLGTFLVQTPSSQFNGKSREVTMDAYTPLLELKEKLPPLGRYILKGSNILNEAYKIVRDNVRAPVVQPVYDEDTSDETKVLANHFVANTDDTQLSFTSDLLEYARYMLSLDEMGRILFSPNQDTASLQPVWTYDDGNSSILYPDITVNHDLFDIPNVVEVVYSNGEDRYEARVKNKDENSPTSTISRGREILHRDTSPKISGVVTQRTVEEYAERLLKEMSTVEYTVSYTHAYCPVNINDCVRLNYEAAGITNIKAKVISQDIKCEPGCPVSEKAVFTTKLWR